MDNQDDSPADSDIDLAELERIWMSHELHDGLLQWVIGAKMQAEAMYAHSVDGTVPTEDQLKNLCTVLSRAMLEGRQLLAGLRPAELDESDWHAALKQWAGIAQTGSKTALDFQLDADTVSISETLQRCVYRIVQESIGNVLRHAHADQVRIEARFDGDTLVVSIEDDGQGFDPSDVGSDRYGLKGIRERAALLKGTARIESRPGSGTRVEVRLPRNE